MMGANVEMGATTIMMCLFFGTNFLLYLLFQTIKFTTRPNNQLVSNEKGQKELSKPFVGTIDCFTNLTSELFITGLIMGLTYICENHWIFDHSTKAYSRDLFLFVLILFFAYAFYTIKPVHDLTLLGREQTEEWKGWMQFIFLLYHYFHAEEVYNSVRVMITCYVWMTGFGNLQFFFLKQDYGWLRVFQMMWRLNFSVLLLMWTHGNTYILYYICPMHTFYFLMVYATMYVYSSTNTSKWGIRWKLMVLGLLIFIVWDVNGGLFDFLFAWLGTDKIIGANNGSVWEYYFRTSLDHWSSFLGMVFAVNFPLAEQYFRNAKGWPLVVASIAMGSLTLWWLVYCFPLEKVEYNMTHSYFAIIPLTSYIFFRNLTPAIRSGVSMSLHDLGKTTLETYLLQHHIWLTSNAKTLLTIVPEHPWINFALATMLFFFVAKELNRLTMSLRGMVMPEDKNIAWTNTIASVLIVGFLYILGHGLHMFHPSLLTIGLACLGLTLVCLLLIHRFTRNGDNGVYQVFSGRAIAVVLGLAVLCSMYLMFLNSAASGETGTLAAAAKGPVYQGNSKSCLDAISHGHWIKVKCSEPTAAKPSKSAYCSTDQWVWDAEADCPVSRFDQSKLRSVFKTKQLLFVGDSSVRSAYHQFIALLEPGYQQNHSASFYHSNIQYRPSFDKNSSISFVWAPLLENVTTTLRQQVYVDVAAVKPKYDMVVCGAAYWDALYTRDVAAYSAQFGGLMKSLAPAARPSAINIWLLPTTVVDDHLTSADKQRYMTESVMEKYREAARSTVTSMGGSGSAFFQTVVDPTPVSRTREGGTPDGIHYGEEVYQVVAHQLVNAYALHFPVHYSSKAALAAKKPYVPKVTGSMSNPFYGAMMLLLACAMLVLMDAFLGIGYISLALFGRSYDWDTAYAPFLKAAQSHANRNASAGHVEPPVAVAPSHPVANDEEEALL